MNDDIFIKISHIPLFVFWAIVGILAYLLYYSFDLIYNNLRNWVVVKLFFIKAKEVHKLNLKHYLLRIFIHIGIILAYFVFIVLIIFIATSLGTFIYNKDIYFNQFVQNVQLKLIKKLFYSSLFGCLLFYFVKFFNYIHNKMIEEEITEEHELGMFRNK